MKRTIWRAGVVGFALSANACGGRVDPDLGLCPPGETCEPDGGVSPDGAVPDSWVSPDGYLPPPDGAPGTCGSGSCKPGSVCAIPCGSCACIGDGLWTCSGTTDCLDGGPPPPPPDTAYPVCPAYEPRDGDACIGLEAMTCGWTSACDAKVYGYCSGGRWAIKSEPCPSGCPFARPPEGTSCTSTEPYPYCKYPSSCGSIDFAYCTRGRWSYAPSDCPPPPPPCPVYTPSADSYCEADGTTCGTTSACGGRDLSRCVAHAWKISVGPCPPPPPMCPAFIPVDGTACGSTRLDCPYPNACGGFDFAQCIPGPGTGRWSIKGTCVGGSCPLAEPTSGAFCSTPSSTMCSYAKPSGCSSSCFCARDFRWACYDPPCFPPPPFDGGATVDGGAAIDAPGPDVSKPKIGG